MRTTHTRHEWPRVASVVAALMLTTPVIAQERPPIEGATGTIALQGTVDQEYGGANVVIVKTMDGVRHVFQVAKGLLVHGGPRAEDESLAGLRTGTVVLVHYTVTGGQASAQEIDRLGDGGLQSTEGIVVSIDRRGRTITIRFDSQHTQTFQLTDRAAADAGRDLDTSAGPSRVIVYYADESGRQVAHFFTRVS